MPANRSRKIKVPKSPKQWQPICDNCHKSFNGNLGQVIHGAKIFVVPRLIMLSSTTMPSVPLVIPGTELHLLICSSCNQDLGEPVAVEDRGRFGEQQIIWAKKTDETGAIKLYETCDICSNRLPIEDDVVPKDLAENLRVPRLVHLNGVLQAIETRGSEITTIICRKCGGERGHPLAVELTWRFKADLIKLVKLRPTKPDNKN